LTDGRGTREEKRCIDKYLVFWAKISFKTLRFPNPKFPIPFFQVKQSISLLDGGFSVQQTTVNEQRQMHFTNFALPTSMGIFIYD